MRILVVGAGVVGLSCAVRLAESGHDVHVLARDLPLETTSSVAAALWYPYRAQPPEQVTAWAATTYAELARLAKHAPQAAVTLRSGTELMRRATPDPWWVGALPRTPAGPPLRRLPAPARPPGWADVWRFDAPVIDMPHYLRWLGARLEELGATLTRAALPALPSAPMVVNCTGVAARGLAGDPSVTSVRGQVVIVEQFGLREWLLAGATDPEPVYLVPRAD